MTMGTPRDVVIAAPFYQGSERVVKLKCAKDGSALEVKEMDKEDRWNDNPLNTSPVLTIPGQHIHIDCPRNNAGECIGTDRIDNSISWEKRKYFVPFFENLRLEQTNLLDIATLDSLV